MIETALEDTFARDQMPPPEELPRFLFELPELHYPSRLNAAVELLEHQVEAGLGEKTAILTPRERWSYRELAVRSNRIARVLREDLGLIPGNRVLLRSANNPMLAACWLGVLKAGGIAVTTMPLLRSRELVPIVDKARVSHALCDARLAGELESVRDETDWLGRICCYSPPGESGAELESLMSRHGEEFQAMETASTDVAIIAFTSGTTGSPKGTLHFHRDILSMCHCVAGRLLGTGPEDIFIGSPPLAFTYGLGGLLAFPLFSGGTAVLLERASPAPLLEAIEQFGATACFTAPTAYRAMLAESGHHRFESLRTCVSAGEHLPAATFHAWQEATGVALIDGIGSTELTHIFISATGRQIRPGATGLVVPGYRAQVVDERMQPLPPGEVGRLAVQGPTGCKYLADPRQRRYVEQGWNLTGDAYRMDEEGYFWFQSRTDDLIISSGYNISGIEVEGALLDHPAVAECAVVGWPDPERGQIVKAFVVLREGHPPDEATARTLQEFVKREIAPYKYPRAVEFVPDLPRTQTGKIQRFRLRQDSSG